LFATLQEYEDVKGVRLQLEKQEKGLREEIDMKLSDYDDNEIVVNSFTEVEASDGYLVKYTPTERRSISREKLIERGVSLEVLLYATEVTSSRRLSFKRG